MGDPDRSRAIASVLSAARAIGLELDADEAAEWATAMSSGAGGSLDVGVERRVYGHRVTQADRDPAAAVRFSFMAGVARLEDRPPGVTTALALAGPAAQRTVRRFPDDCEFVERVHLRTDDHSSARILLAEAVYDKAIATMRGPGYRLRQVVFGTWPADAVVDDRRLPTGSVVRWHPRDVERGEIASGGPLAATALTWEDAARDPGWCRLEWVVASPTRGTIATVGSSLDVTWEAPNGQTAPLDGFLEPYFREVRGDSDAIPIFTRLMAEFGADCVADYVERLHQEIGSFGCALADHRCAARLYLVFRLTGRYAEATHVRELFDERSARSNEASFARSLRAVPSIAAYLDEVAGSNVWRAFTRRA